MSDYKCPRCGEGKNLGIARTATPQAPYPHCFLPKRNQEAKADAGKLMLELIPPEAFEALGRVLTHGAKKYGANKWQTIDDAKNRYSGALLRHYTAYQKNNAGTDADSGLLHIEHVLCNAMFLAVLELRENGGKVI